MNDEDGPDVAGEFYREFFKDAADIDSSRAAYALHKAVQHLRAKDVSPVRWAAFIHVGV